MPRSQEKMSFCVIVAMRETPMKETMTDFLHRIGTMQTRGKFR